MNSILSYLKNKQLVWHANHVQPCLPSGTSGFSDLDAQLEGGFPERGVIDIHSPVGIGELRLLLPSLYSRQQSSGRLLVFIAPPMQLNSEMLADYGLSLSQILVIQPDTPQHALWSAEQCLKSGCCQGVLLWHQALEIHQVKRLQMAAEHGDALQFLLRNPGQISQSLPVTLAMRLDAHPQGVAAHITKRKGSWAGTPFVLDMHQHWPQLTIPARSNNVLRFPVSKVS